MAQLVKNLPAMQKTRVQTLGQEDPLEKGMATHSSILAWRIPHTEEPGRLQSVGSQKLRHTEQLTLSLFEKLWATPWLLQNPGYALSIPIATPASPESGRAREGGRG